MSQFSELEDWGDDVLDEIVALRPPTAVPPPPTAVPPPPPTAVPPPPPTAVPPAPPTAAELSVEPAEPSAAPAAELSAELAFPEWEFKEEELRQIDAACAISSSLGASTAAEAPSAPVAPTSAETAPVTAAAALQVVPTPVAVSPVLSLAATVKQAPAAVAVPVVQTASIVASASVLEPSAPPEEPAVAMTPTAQPPTKKRKRPCDRLSSVQPIGTSPSTNKAVSAVKLRSQQKIPQMLRVQQLKTAAGGPPANKRPRDDSDSPLLSQESTQLAEMHRSSNIEETGNELVAWLKRHGLKVDSSLGLKSNGCVARQAFEQLVVTSLHQLQQILSNCPVEANQSPPSWIGYLAARMSSRSSRRNLLQQQCIAALTVLAHFRTVSDTAQKALIDSCDDERVGVKEYASELLHVVGAEASAQPSCSNELMEYDATLKERDGEGSEESMWVCKLQSQSGQHDDLTFRFPNHPSAEELLNAVEQELNKERGGAVVVNKVSLHVSWTCSRCTLVNVATQVCHVCGSSAVEKTVEKTAELPTEKLLRVVMERAIEEVNTVVDIRENGTAASAEANVGAAAEEDPVPSHGLIGNNVIHHQQWVIALELAERIRRIYGIDWSELYKRFKKVDFCIFTANLCTVADQTLKRVEGRGVCEGDAKPSDRVIRYTAPRKPVAGSVLPEFAEFKKRVLAHPSTLFVMIPDECHWGALQGSPHDRYVNDPELNQAENVVVLLVSATPYCTLTLDSRLQERYVSGDNETGIFAHTNPNGERKFYVQDPDRVECLSEVQEPDPKLVTDLHLVSWQEVARTSGANPHRLTTDADVGWLQQQMPEEMGDVAAHNYQSLGEVLKSTHESLKCAQLLRCDKDFEKLIQNSHFRTTDPSLVLAVDYVFHLLLHLQRSKHFSDTTSFSDAASWFLDAPYGFRKITKSYIQIAGGPPYQAHSPLTSGHVEQLVNEKCSSRHMSETRNIIEQLLDPQKVRMQVLRVGETKEGQAILKFLKAARQQFGVSSKFELLGDFKDLVIKKEMDRGWFESLQVGRKCEHRIGKLRTRCTCTEYLPPRGQLHCTPCETGLGTECGSACIKLFSKKSVQCKNKQCAGCGHAHNSICSYGDLSNRPLLLILVAKGRLGDTFPATLNCLDMRARNRFTNRNEAPCTSTVIQEIGRLCRYYKDGDERPCALLSKSLYSMVVAKMPKEQELLGFIRQSSNLDIHMKLKHEAMWSQGNAQSLHELAPLMRQCFSACGSGDAASTIMYDAERRRTTELPHPPTLAAMTARYHARRLLLFAEPQIGKTGAFLGLIEVLRKRLVPLPGEVDDGGRSDNEGGCIGGSDNGYPDYGTMQRQAFEHNKQTPGVGKYGDPAHDPLWEFYLNGGMGSDVPTHIKTGGRPSTASTADLTCISNNHSDSAPKPAAVPHARPRAEQLQLCKRARYELRKPYPSNNGAAAARHEHAISVAHPSGAVTCKLSLTERSFREDFDANSETIRLRDFRGQSSERVLFPIFMPSAGRPKTARLDLSDAMQHKAGPSEDWGYVQFVCIKENEFTQYKEQSPHLNFLVLPKRANTLGIGASRHYTLLVAAKICPPSFRCVFVMDDNVQAWKAIDTGNGQRCDPVFKSFGYPLEVFKDGRTGTKKDLPLREVLKHFQDDAFRDCLYKFGMIGFDRFGRRSTPVMQPYARRHVYKAVIINLDIIGLSNYRELQHIWEDLEFNLRISGRVRTSDGASRALEQSKCTSMGDGAVWVDSNSKRANGEPILDPDDPPGPAVILKCYRFQYIQDQSSAKHGGCSGHILRLDGTPGENCHPECVDTVPDSNALPVRCLASDTDLTLDSLLSQCRALPHKGAVETEFEAAVGAVVPKLRKMLTKNKPLLEATLKEIGFKASQIMDLEELLET